MQDERPDASVYFTGAAGAVQRQRNIWGVFRNAVGDYRVIWPLGRERRAAEYDFKVVAVGAAARIVQLGDTGSTAAPGGAAAPAGSLALQILTFDAAGAAADADCVVTAERV